jgi:hypothetical protein
MAIMEVCKPLKRVAGAAITAERAESSGACMWALRAALGHGLGWQAMKHEVCTELDKDYYDTEVWPEWSLLKVEQRVD